MFYGDGIYDRHMTFRTLCCFTFLATLLVHDRHRTFLATLLVHFFCSETTISVVQTVLFCLKLTVVNGNNPMGYAMLSLLKKLAR